MVGGTLNDFVRSTTRGRVEPATESAAVPKAQRTTTAPTYTSTVPQPASFPLCLRVTTVSLFLKKQAVVVYVPMT